MNPIQPGSKAHPTGQHYNTSLALADNKHRWQRSAKLINDVVDRIPRTKIDVPKEDAPKVTKKEKRTAALAANKHQASYIISNSDFALPDELVSEELVLMVNAARYEYRIDASLMDSVMASIQRIMTGEVLGGADALTSNFFLSQYLNDAAKDGATDSFESAVKITIGTSAAQSLANVNLAQRLASPQYLDRLQLVNGRVFESMKSLTGDMKAQLRVTLSEGMARGVGIRDLKGMINKRLGIGMGRAERIARTEINNAYRQSYLNEATDLNEDALKDDQWKIMQVHRSALAPTTRRNHAIRHGTIHTIRAQKDWWATGSNSINCLCSTLDILVNKETGEVIQEKMIERMQKERRQWYPQ